MTRIASLDQFRGYTVLGMFLVNFAAGFAVLPDLIRHHHTYCSYADTIMPQFFFAVGFAYRLTYLRNRAANGTTAAMGRALRRNLGLLLLGIVVHRLEGGVRSWEELTSLGLDGFLQTAFQRRPFETLVHIAVTSLWVLPVIGAGAGVRIGFALGSAGVFWLVSRDFYYTWVMTRPGIDGGPLGFLTWTVPVLVGSLAYDAVSAGPTPSAIRRLLGWGVVLMALGYGLSCLWRALDPDATTFFADPPFVAPANSEDLRQQLSKMPENASHMLWIMSQRAGSPSYQVFGAGFALALYALFVWACDRGNFRLAVLETFGTNALAAYVIHELVGAAMHPYTPRDAPLWYVLASIAMFFTICWLFVRHLEKHKLFLRL